MSNDPATTRPTSVWISISRGSVYRDAMLDVLRACIAPERIHLVSTEDEIAAIRPEDGRGSVFANFDNGVIVPASVLEMFEFPAYNYHSAPPEYPGRDPHHFAIYNKAAFFGATLHLMVAKVDAGPIIDFVRFPITPDDTYSTLWKKGLEAGLELFRKHMPDVLAGRLPPTTDTAWGAKKYARKDFRELCRITPDISAEELEARVRAFHVPGYDNIQLDLHGHTFHLNS